MKQDKHTARKPEKRSFQSKSRKKSKPVSSELSADELADSQTSTTRFPHANDPAWRLQNPELSGNVGSILFSDPLGKFYQNDGQIFLPSEKNPARITINWSAAGVMIFDTLALWGEATSPTSPTNIMASKIQWLANVKWYNATGYAPSDIMAMIMAVDAIHCTIYEAIRVYALVSKFATENRYFGKALIEALGWDYSDINSNLAEFRYQINLAISKVNQLHIPNIFYVLDSHRNLFTSVFTESPNSSKKAQLYIFRQNSYWQWDDSTGTLQAKRWNSSSAAQTNTVAQWASIVTSQLDAVLNSDFIAKMDADLLRVFPLNETMHLDPIGDTLLIEFKYDPLMLCQIMNAEFMNAVISKIELTDVKQWSSSISSGYPAAHGTTLTEGQPNLAIFAKYETHLGDRTDLLGSTIQVAGLLKNGDTSRTVDQTCTQLLTQISPNCCPLSSNRTKSWHYFNVLDILPKDPGTLLETAHFKFNLTKQNAGATDTKTIQQLYTIRDFQDALIFGTRFMQISASNTVEQVGVLPALILKPRIMTGAASQPYYLATVTELTTVLAGYWQFSMPPMLFMADTYAQVDGDNMYAFKPFTEMQDMYVAGEDELRRFNYVAVESLWATSRLPIVRNGGASMNGR